MSEERELRRCKKCGVDRIIRDFHRQPCYPDGRKKVCRFCHNAARREYHRNGGREVQRQYKLRLVKANRQRMIEYLSEQSCKDCGESNPIVLDFHHKQNKTSDISSLLSRALSWERIVKEIQKCDVLCANCHRIHHAVQDYHWKAELLGVRAQTQEAEGDE